MNNSEKQAAAFEAKWTCEEPESRQTLTATVHPRRSKTQEKHILISVFFFNFFNTTDVCLFADESLNR